MEDMTDRAMNKGKAKAKEAYEDQVAQSLKNGASAARKRTAIDHALPPLRLTFREKDKQGEVQYITDPIKVASKHTDSWCGTWGAYDESFEDNVIKYFVALRAKHLDAASGNHYYVNANTQVCPTTPPSFNMCSLKTVFLERSVRNTNVLYRALMANVIVET